MFSIIVPIYNSEEYLNECLLSFDRQSFGDFELVLVDDGSIDHSPDICNGYIETHQNARLIQQANSGQNAARLTGLMESKGDYILFVDSDDCIRADALEQLDSVVHKENVDVICFDYCQGVDCSFTNGVIQPNFLQPGFSDSLESCGVYRALCSGESNSLCNKVYKTSLITNAFKNLKDYDYLRHGEDLFALISIIDQAKSIFYLPECLYFYRKADSGITAKFSDNNIRDLRIVFSRLIYMSSRWGSDCELLANIAALKHLYWCLLSLTSTNFGIQDKISRIELISTSMKRICTLDFSTILPNLRWDFLIPVWLLLNGHYRFALSWAELINSVMKAFR